MCRSELRQGGAELCKVRRVGVRKTNERGRERQAVREAGWRDGGHGHGHGILYLASSRALVLVGRAVRRLSEVRDEVT